MVGVTKQTLTAATAKKIVTGGVGTRTALVHSALTDVFFGGPGVTSANGLPIADLDPAATIPCGNDDLYAISATGGDIFVLVADNG